MPSFSPFPQLETPRLVLRALTPARPADLDVVFRIRSDREATRYLGRDPDRSIDASLANLRAVEAAIADGTGIRWGIVTMADGALIGTAGLWRWNEPHRWAELGYDLLPACWGRGYMAEALRAIVRWGFGAANLHRIEANVDPANARSVRVLESLGFSSEGRLRENWLHAGAFTDSQIFGLLRTDLARRRTIFHIAEREVWNRARAGGKYALPGPFIHASTAAQVVDTANRFFVDDSRQEAARPLVLLCIDAARLTTRVIDEPAADAGGALFPHMYGAIDTAAVICVEPFGRDVDGRFASTPAVRAALYP
jgi:ribosomal-protein-alanine N-acetyltransferase